MVISIFGFIGSVSYQSVALQMALLLCIWTILHHFRILELGFQQLWKVGMIVKYSTCDGDVLV